MKDRNGVEIQMGDIVTGRVNGRAYDVTGPAVHLIGDKDAQNVGITLGTWGPEGCGWSTEYATAGEVEIIAPADAVAGVSPPANAVRTELAAPTPQE